MHRGGRVNGIEKVLGSLLQIKPVLHVDREGRLAPVAKVRGRQKSFAKLVELMGERMADVNFLKEQTVFITHGAVLEEANQLKKMIDLLGIADGAQAVVGDMLYFTQNFT